MKTLLLLLSTTVLETIRGWLGKKKASAEDLARALDIERKTDAADKRAAADNRDLDQRLRDVDGLR